MLAKSLFDLREFKKCANSLRECVGEHNQQAIFLYYYSLYMFGEVRKEEEILETEQGHKQAVNGELRSIEREMSGLHQAGKLNEVLMHLFSCASSTCTCTRSC